MRQAGLKLAVVACSVILATLLTFPLASRTVHSRDLLFIAAITLVSRYSGVLSGVSVALFSVGVFDWYFDRNPHVFDLTLASGLRAVVFVVVSLTVALLDRQRRRATEILITSNCELKKALDEVKTLRGILPICSYCKRINTAPETWVEVENYIRRNSEAEFSHGVCPDCIRKYFPELLVHQ